MIFRVSNCFTPFQATECLFRRRLPPHWRTIEMLTLNLLLGMDDKVGWGTLTNVTGNKLHTGNVETSKL